MYKFIISKEAYWKPVEIKIDEKNPTEAVEKLNEFLENYDWGSYDECQYVLEECVKKEDE